MPYYEDDLNLGNFAAGTIPTYSPPRTAYDPVYQAPPVGLGYGNIGGGGEESASPVASDHVDDYGNTPATPPNTWSGNAPGVATVMLPPSPAAGDGGGWTPPNLFGVWQPPTIGANLDLTPGARTGLPWMKDGELDLAPGARTGFPWMKDGQLDLNPGAGIGLPSVTLPDVTKPFDNIMLMMVLMMSSRR